MAGMTIAYYIVAPIWYALGKPVQDVNDFLYDLHERFVIFCSCTATGVQVGEHEWDAKKLKT